jgi:hypothetical protein
LLGVAATLTVLAAAPSNASAQRPGGWVEGRYRDAYERGFREGTEQGNRDVRSGRSMDLQRHEEYRRADAGYSNRYGDRGDYQRTFRDGFTDGYRAAFQRGPGVYDRRGPVNGGFGRPTRGFQDPASARGYSDGFEHGVDDGRDRDRYDPVRHGDYKSADDGYNRNYGSKDSYRNNYRAGFRQGYEDGYRDGTRRR